MTSSNIRFSIKIRNDVQEVCILLIWHSSGSVMKHEDNSYAGGKMTREYSPSSSQADLLFLGNCFRK